MASQEHQSAAVLFSDIEGYTSKMQENESEAITMVNRYQIQLEKTVPLYHGQVMQYYGDGSLTIFPKAADAVACALDLQRNLQGSIPLRIGIHYGKVVFHQQKVFGDTVNLASRIESLGQPGAVLFSQEVLNQIKSVSEFKVVSMGQYKFKNVAREMEVFALGNDGINLPKAGSLQGKLQGRKSSKKTTAVLISLAVLAVILLSVIYGIRSQLPVTNSSLIAKSNPSIAVLPFANLSPDSSQEYFADGLAQELLTMLTQDPQLRVTSRSSSFSFKGQRVDIPTIAEKLRVQYVLDGSVRKAGDSVRISTQLIDAGEDQQLWAQSWQRKVSDIFSVQQEIADSVKKALQILTNKSKQIQKTDPEVYTLYLQAKHIGQQGSVNGLLNAETLLLKVVEIDSTYAPAWAYLSTILNRLSNIGARPSIEGHQSAREAANRAMRIDSTLSTAWATLASISIYFDRDFQQAEYYVEKALEIEPSSLNNLKLASILAFCFGNIKQAIQLDQQAIEIDPINAKGYFDLGYDYFYDGQYVEAERAAKQGLLMNPDHLAGPYLLSLILMEQGRFQEAKQAAISEPYEILSVQARALIASSQGEMDSAAYFLHQIKDEYSNIAPYQIAQVYSHQHQKDSAFKWLDLAYEYRDGGLVQVQADPFMSVLKKDRRWEVLMSKMGFPGV